MHSILWLSQGIGVNAFRLENAQTIVVDGTLSAAKLTRDALFEFGFREIELLEDISRARSRLGAAAADLLICAAEASDRGCSALFNDIRDGKIGDDVFLPIIATVREPKVDLIHDLVNGGVDLILTVPMSQAKLSRAVTTIIDIRKPFVVTSEYFGPDRREKSRARVSDVPLIRVPNSLRHKATGDDGGVDAQALANSVRTCASRLTSTKSSSPPA